MRRDLDKLIVELTLIAESSSTIIQAATDREVKEQCHGIVEALKQFDVLFAMLRIKNGATDDCCFDHVCLHAKRALECWQGLHLSATVKAHVIEDHAIDQMERLNGFGAIIDLISKYG